MRLCKEIVSDLQRLHTNEIEHLQWTLNAPFKLSPWKLCPTGVALYRSKSLDKYIEKVLQEKVKGKGMGMSKQELFETIRKVCPGIGIWIIGGFVRDAVQGIPGNDIDIKFICGKDGIRKMARVAQKNGWIYSIQTPNLEQKCTCEGKGRQGWTSANCECMWKATNFGQRYIRFGDQEKRDV